MRYLRLIPLLVLVFGAPASADDHRVNFNGMLSLASGSSLFGAHGSVALRVGPPKFTVVLSDNSYHRGSHDEDTMTARREHVGRPLDPAVVRHATQDCAAVLLRFVDTNDCWRLQARIRLCARCGGMQVRFRDTDRPG